MGASDTRAQRDFWLAEHSARIMDTTAGLAHTTLSIVPPRERGRSAEAIECAKEIGRRFSELAATVQSFALDYRDSMTEAELRAWAQQLVRAVT